MRDLEGQSQQVSIRTCDGLYFLQQNFRAQRAIKGMPKVS